MRDCEQIVNSTKVKNKNIAEYEGTVIEPLPNTLFKIELDDKRIVLASVAGRLRRSFLRMLPGDKVRIEMTPYDKDRGRIVFKYR